MGTLEDCRDEVGPPLNSKLAPQSEYLLTSQTIKTMKPIWKSKTVRANVLTFAIALFPHLEAYSRNGRLTSVEVTAIIGTFLLTCVAIEGRHDSTEIVYTPKGWPGRNPEDARQMEHDRRM